jgi:hypothetical protein
VQWHSWSPAPFRAAADSNRPLLLFVATQWSRGCGQMERTTLADPRVRTIVDSDYVAVRVDADLRPDVADRYALGAWPSTLLLTVEGEVLQGGTYFDAPALADLLERTSATYRRARAALSRRAQDAKADRRRAAADRGFSDDGAQASPDDIAPALLARSDPAGGFLGAPKFLHEDATLFFLRCGSPEAHAAARCTLDAAVRALHGPDGEMFRCANGEDWTAAVPEATPESHSSAIRLLTEGSFCFDGRYAGPLRSAISFARRTWLGGADQSLTTERGADLASACLAAARFLEDPSLGRSALALLERVSLGTYRPGAGVRHSTAADAPSLVSDHIATIAALLDAHDATGELPYAMLGEELGHRMLDAFLDEEAGALRDRVHDADDVGRLSEPLYPYAANARAAHALDRLAVVSGDPLFAESAARLLGWAGARWREQGLDAASCGIAALHLID